MSIEKYQIKEKAQYLNLLILKDDLQHFHRMLNKQIKGLESSISSLRNTRFVFLILNSVRETADRTNLKGSPGFVDQTRKIRKKLKFVNHFRNKAIGHLDTVALERAVQWSPGLFSETIKDDLEIQILEGNKTLIETAINSFIDAEKKQKVFGTEIDLYFPPDNKKFYKYLWEIVTESINWITAALSILSSQIKYSNHQELAEIASIAGQTDFNLKKGSVFEYDQSETKKNFETAIGKIKEMGVNQDVLDLLENMKNDHF